jgi:hypothetical protein
MSAEDKTTFTTAELAKRWSMSPITLSNWRQKGIGPSYTKIGRVVIYRLQDVLSYEQSKVVNPSRERV